LRRKFLVYGNKLERTIRPQERVEVRYLAPVGDITGKGEKI